jgi:hypothetical protein
MRCVLDLYLLSVDFMNTLIAVFHGYGSGQSPPNKHKFFDLIYIHDVTRIRLADLLKQVLNIRLDIVLGEFLFSY